jgi:SAM-dependent methyltransferase
VAESGRKVRRVDARVGYDLWAETYDRTPNPLVALDSRHTPRLLAPAAGERILDCGCGTGRHLGAVLAAGAVPLGLDAASGMLEVSRRRHPGAPLVQADLDEPLPLRSGAFDAALCCLVGEHLDRPVRLFHELFRVTRPGGRLLFTVFHPAMVASSVEANFVREGVEYRLGATPHTLDVYRLGAAAAGFEALELEEHAVDEALVREVPEVAKYLGRPLLLVVMGRVPAGGPGTAAAP